MPASTFGIDGQQIYLVDEGSATSSAPLLLIHGFPGSWFALRTTERYPTPHDLARIADLSGIGESSVSGQTDPPRPRSSIRSG